MSSTDGLAMRARFLRNAAPREFLDFLNAFGDYANHQNDILLQVTQNWQQAQGHAQQCKKILDVLEGVKNG